MFQKYIEIRAGRKTCGSGWKNLARPHTPKKELPISRSGSDRRVTGGKPGRQDE